MVIFENENILGIVMENIRLFGIKLIFNKLHNKILNKTILKVSTYENIFKSLGKTHYKLLRQRGTVNNLVKLHNGDIVLTLGSLKTIEVWDLNNNICKKIIENEPTALYASVLNDDNLVTTSYKGIKLWDTNNDFECIKYQNLNMLGVVTNIISLHNGNIACTARHNAIIIILNNDLTYIKTTDAHFVNSLINLSKNRIANGSDDTTIKIWGVDNDYKCLRTLTGLSSWIVSLLFVNKYDLLISASPDKTICFWNLEDYICVKTICVGYKTRQLLLLPNGYFACTLLDITIGIWNLAKYECVNTIQTYTDNTSLLLLNDNRIAGAYENIVVWEF
jgi:WD40 repeat protein